MTLSFPPLQTLMLLRKHLGGVPSLFDERRRVTLGVISNSQPFLYLAWLTTRFPISLFRHNVLVSLKAARSSTIVPKSVQTFVLSLFYGIYSGISPRFRIMKDEGAKLGYTSLRIMSPP